MASPSKSNAKGSNSGRDHLKDQRLLPAEAPEKIFLHDNPALLTGSWTPTTCMATASPIISQSNGVRDSCDISASLQRPLSAGNQDVDSLFSRRKKSLEREEEAFQALMRGSGHHPSPPKPGRLDRLTDNVRAVSPIPCVMRTDFDERKAREFTSIYNKLAQKASDASRGTCVPKAKVVLPVLSDGPKEVPTVINEVDSGCDLPLTAEELASPRHTFLRRMVERGLPPRAHLIIRRSLMPNIQLQHQGMGDDLCSMLAECVANLPNPIESVNVRDNRLSDRGLAPLLAALRQKSELVHLDLSRNKIDVVAAANLATFINNPDCRLQKLVVSMADIDDRECRVLMEAMRRNTTILELDLSKNVIGTSESLNVVMPSVITGGKAIGSMLSENRTLKKLDISWNTIRLNSASDIGKSLLINATLTELNLSYNGFGDAGASSLADAVAMNKALLRLELGNNNISAHAAYVLASSLNRNKTIEYIGVAGNPLGSKGCKALLQHVAGPVTRNLEVNLSDCNLGGRTDDSHKFDSENPAGTHVLDMTAAYDRAVAREIFRIAEQRPGVELCSVEHTSASGVLTNVVLVRKSDPIMRASICTLENDGKLHALTLSKLFGDLDVDGSGDISAAELEKGMRLLGLQPVMGEAEQLVARHDMNNTGKVELDEFVDIVHTIFAERKRTIRPLVEQCSGAPYDLPDNGKLKIEMQDLQKLKPRRHTITETGVSRLIQNLNKLQNKVQVLDTVMGELLFKADEAQRVLDEVLGELDKVHALLKLLPYMVSNRHAHLLMNSNLDGKEKRRLQHFLGQAYGPIVGLLTGHYRLDLSDPMDRLALKRLIEANVLEVENRKRTNPTIQDLSQTGNWSNFRNEYYNGVRLTLNTEFMVKLPPSGFLELDYVSTSRPSPETAMSSNRFQDVIRALCLDSFNESCGSRDKSESLGLRTCFLLRFTAEDGSEANEPQTYETYKPKRTKETFEILHRFRASGANGHYDMVDTIKQVSITNKENETLVWTASRFLMELHQQVFVKNVSSVQIVTLLRRWPVEFQRSRIEAVITLFSRIVDLENFDRILAELDERETANVIHRIGWLNFWSPMKPQEYYELELSQREDREIARLLMLLALEEPGQNWQDSFFGWERGKLIPGWTLNASWYSEEGSGMPQRGYLGLTYYEGKDKDCAPNFKIREQLLGKSTLVGCVPSSGLDFIADTDL